MPAFTLTSGTFIAPDGVMTVNGAFTVTGGTFNTVNNSGTVQFLNENNYTVDAENVDFYNVTFNKTANRYAATITLSTDFTVKNNLVLRNDFTYQLIVQGADGIYPEITVEGDFKIEDSATGTALAIGGSSSANRVTYDVKGDVLISESNLNWRNTNLALSGTGDQDISHTAGSVSSGAWTADKASGNVILLTDLTTGTSLGVTQGALDLNGHDISVGGGLTVGSGGTIILRGTETFTSPTLVSGSTVHYTTIDPTFTIGNYAYKNLTLEGAVDTVFSLPASMTGLGTLTLESGALHVDGYDLSAAALENSGILRLNGDETVDFTSMDTDSGTVEYVGSGDYFTGYTSLGAGDAYYDLVFNGTGQWKMSTNVEGDWTITSGTVDMVGDVDVTGSVMIDTSAVLNTNGNNITVGGDWENTGSFNTSGAGGVTLAGVDQTISGETTFFNLTKVVTEPAVLTFEKDKTQTITNSLQLEGANPSNMLHIKSSENGTQWKIDPPDAAGRDLSYLEIQDSNNVGGETIDVSLDGCDDLENNSNWIFDTTDPLTWIGSTNSAWTEPTNWLGGSVPSSTQRAIFDGTSSADCLINTNVTVGALLIKAAYAGTLQQDDVTFTISNNIYTSPSGYTQEGGTFIATGGTTRINANMTYSGGTFTSCADHTLEFYDNHSQVELNSQTINVGNLWINNNSVRHWSIKDGSTLTVGGFDLGDGDLTLSGGYWTATYTGTYGRVGVYGDVLVENVWDGPYYYGGRLDFRGDRAQSISIEDNRVVTGLNIFLKKDSNTVTVNDSFECSGLNIQTGTFDAAGYDVTNNGPYSQSGGEFTTTGGTLKVAGNFTHSAGTFTTGATHLLEFYGDNSQLNFGGTSGDPKGLTVSNLKVNLSGGKHFSIKDYSTITVGGVSLGDGNVTFTNGYWTVTTGQYGVIEAYGDFLVGTPWDGPYYYGGTFIFKGDRPQTITTNNTVTAANIFVSKSSRTVTLMDALECSGLNLQGGIFDAAGYDLTINGPYTQTGGDFTTTSGTMKVGGDFTHSSGTFTIGAAHIVEFYNGSSRLDFGGQSGDPKGFAISNLKVNLNGGDHFSIKDYNTLTVGGINPGDGDVTFTEGYWTVTTGLYGTVEAYGDVLVEDTWNGPYYYDGTFVFKGDRAQSFDVEAAIETGLMLYVNKDSNTVDLNNPVICGALHINGGTFNTNGNDVTISYTFYQACEFSQSGGEFNAPSGTLSVPHDFSHSGGSFNVGPEHLVLFTSNDSTFVNLNGGTLTISNLEIDTTSGRGMYIESGGTLKVGGVDPLDGNVTFTNGMYFWFGGYTGYLEIHGALDVESGWDGGEGRVRFAGDRDQEFDLSGATDKYNNWTYISKTGGSVKFLSDIVMNATNHSVPGSYQSLYVQEGVLDLAGQNLTVTNGDFDVEDGGVLKLQGDETVTSPSLSSGSTVIYTGEDGPYTIKPWNYANADIVFEGETEYRINGTNSFESLICETPGATLVFDSTGVQTIGTLTLTGTDINPVNITSSSPGTPAEISVTSSVVEDVWVSDSSNTSGISIDAINSFDLGGNSGWVFSSPYISWTGAISNDWSIDGNWLGDLAPTTGDGAAIISATNQPVLTEGIQITGLKIIAGATLDLAGFDFVVTGNAFNWGTLKVRGDEASVSFGTMTDQGTTDYYGDSTYTGLPAGYDYNNLVFSGAGTYTLESPLTVGGNLEINGAVLTAAGNDITLAGSWTNSGTFNADGNVTFTGAGTITSGTSTFDDLTIDATGAYSLADPMTVVNITMDSGELDANDQPITVGGSWTNNGATFTYGTEAVTFDSSSIGNTIKTSGEYFGDLKFDNATGGWILQDPLFADGDLIITAGELNVNGQAVTVGGTFSNSSNTVTSSTGNVSITATGIIAGSIMNLSGGINLTADGINLTTDIMTTGSTINFNGPVLVNASCIISTGSGAGNIVFANTLNGLAGGETLSFLSGTGSVALNDEVGAVNPFGTVAVTGNILFANGANWTLNDSLTVLGNLTIDTGSTLDANGKDITVNGNWTNSGGAFSPSGNSVMFSGSGTQLINAGGVAFNDVTHSGSGTFRVSGTALEIGGSLTNSNGTFDANDLAVTVTEMTTLSGGDYQSKTALQTFLGGMSVVGGNFTGTTGEVLIKGILDLSAGILTAPAADFTVENEWVNNGGTFAVATGGTVVFNGNVDLKDFSTEFENVQINNAATLNLVKSFKINGNLILDPGASLVQGAGINIYVTADGEVTFADGTFTKDPTGEGELHLEGNIVFNPGDNPLSIIVVGASPDTIHLNGNIEYADGLVINSTDNFITHGYSIKVLANLLVIQEGGVLNATHGTQGEIYEVNGEFYQIAENQDTTIYFKGTNWINDGTFIADTSTVIFEDRGVADGDTVQGIYGDTTFNNLTKVIENGEAQTLVFEKGKTQTIKGTLTLRGTSDDLLTIESSQGGVQWNIDPEGARDLDYLVVKDSNNINFQPISLITAADVTDGGNNTNWIFDLPNNPYYTWTGLHATSYSWDEVTNWCINGFAATIAPDDTHDVYFTGIATKECEITGAADVLSINIEPEYTGRVNLKQGGTVTVGVGGYLQSGGTFETTATTATVDVEGAFTLEGGTFKAANSGVTVDGLTSIKGGTYDGAAFQQKFKGGLTISGGSVLGRTGAMVIGSIENLPDEIYIQSDMVLSGGSFTAPSGGIQITGNWLKTAGSFSQETATVDFAGTSLQIIIGGNFYNVTHTTSSIMQLGSSLTVANDFQNSNSTFDASGQSVSVGGTMTIDGSSTYIPSTGNQTFGTLKLMNTAEMDASSCNLTVNDDLKLQGTSYFTAPSAGKTFTLKGDFNRQTTATFLHNDGELTLAGSDQTIFESNTFYKLTKEVSSDDTLYFEIGKTQTVKDKLTLRGNKVGDTISFLSLRSTGTGQWTIAPEGIKDVAYVDVEYSYNDAYDGVEDSTMIRTIDSHDSGNNYGWDIYEPGEIVIDYITWIGGTTNYENDWDTATNWDTGEVPGEEDIVIIPLTANQPVLSSDVTVTNLTLEEDATLETEGNDLTVSGTFESEGIIIVTDDDNLALTNDANSGTVKYLGSVDGVEDTITILDLDTGDGFDYFNLWLYSDDPTAKDIFTITGKLKVGGYLALDKLANFDTNDQEVVTSGTLYLNESEYDAGAQAHVLGGLEMLAGTRFYAGADTPITINGALIVANGASFECPANADVTISGQVTIAVEEEHYDAVTPVISSFTAGAGKLTLGGVSMWVDPPEEEPLPTRTAMAVFTPGTGDVEINGSLELLTDGTTFTAPAGEMKLSGSITKVNSATFNHNFGSVVLDGEDQTISGNLTFYDLEKISGGKTLTFLAGTTQTIEHKLTLTGAGDAVEELLYLRSSEEGTQWGINVTSAEETWYVVNTVSVKDSVNMRYYYAQIPANEIVASASQDAGNNFGWVFAGALYRWASLSETDPMNWSNLDNWRVGTDAPALLPGEEDTIIISSTYDGGAVTSMPILDAMILRDNEPLTYDDNGDGIYDEGDDTFDPLTDDINGNGVWDAAGIRATNMTINSGASLDLNNKAIYVARSFSNNGTLYLTGNETAIDLTNDTNSGTWEYTGIDDATTITVLDFNPLTGNDYYRLRVNCRGYTKNSFDIGADLKVGTSLELLSFDEFDPGAYKVTSGSMTISGGTYLLSSADQQLSGISMLDGATFQTGAGDVTINGNLNVQDGSAFNVTGGTEVTINGSLTLGDQASFVSTDGSGIITISGNLSIPDGATFTGPTGVDPLIVEGTITQSGGTFNAPAALEVGDDLIITPAATYEHNDGLITFYGTKKHTLMTGGDALYDVIQQDGATLQLADILEVDNSLTIEAGNSIDLNGQGLIMTDASFTNSGTMMVRGDETMTDFTNDLASGLTIYYGRSTYSGSGLAAGDEYYNLTFDGRAGSWDMSTIIYADWEILEGTVNMTGDVSVLNNLTIGSEGTLNANAYDVILGGNWLSEGAFDGGTGTVIFAATDGLGHTIDPGDVAFNDVTFSSGSYTLENNTLDINGDVLFLWEEGYSFKKIITIDSALVDVDEDFPVLISIGNDTDLQAGVVNSSGYDILFTDSTGNKLDHEIESYNAATGTLVAWVKTSLSSTKDTGIHMYYGNASISASQDSTSVWDDTSYAGVWHLDEAPSTSGTHYDSTSSGYNGTWYDSNGQGDSNETGQIGGGNKFDGSDDYITMGDVLDMGASQNFTVSFWMKDTKNANPGSLINKFNSVSPGWGVFSWGGTIQFKIHSSGYTDDYVNYAPPETNEWIYIACSRDMSTATIYKDGSYQNSDTLNSGNTSNSRALQIGKRADGSSWYFDGSVDEVRVAMEAKSAEWLQTEYANQSDPGTFYYAGDEGSAPTLNGGENDIEVAGNWTKLAGTSFNADTGAVVFDDVSSTSSITGPTTFNDLVCVVPDKELNFKEGEIFTIEGELQLSGQNPATPVVLDSQDGATQFTLKVTNPQQVYFVDVSNSEVDDTGESITAYESNDNTNNDNAVNARWIFPVDMPAFTWTGLGGDYNWGTAANWGQDSIPGVGDTALFTFASQTDCSVVGTGDTDVVVGGIEIDSSYTGTLTQVTGKTLTVNAAGGYLQESGTFEGGDSDITVKGNFTLSGGIFESTTANLTLEKDVTIGNADYFEHNNGTVTMGGAENSDSTISAGGVLFNNLDLYAVQNWQHNYSTISEGFTVEGDLSVDVNSVAGVQNHGWMASTPITITLEGNYSQDANAYSTFGDDNITLSMTGENKSFTVASGDKKRFNANLDLAGTGKTLVNKAGATYGGTTTINQASGSVALAGDSVFYHMVVNSDKTLDASPDGGTTSYDMTVNGDFDCSASGLIIPREGMITLGGTENYDSTITTGGITFYDLTLYAAQNWQHNYSTITDGFTITNDFTVYVNSVAGMQNHGWTAPTPITINLGGNYSQDANAYSTFGNDNITLVMTGENSSLTVESGNNRLNANLNFNGTGTTLVRNEGAANGGLATMDQASGKIELSGDSVFYDLTVNQGLVELLDHDLVVNNQFQVAEGVEFRLYGDDAQTVTVPTLPADTTVVYNGTGTYSSLKMGSSYYNLTIASGTYTMATDIAGDWTIADGATVTLSDTVNVTGDVSLAGTIDDQAQIINVTGDWNQSGTGDMTTPTGTVNFVGEDQEITGSTTFGNITKTIPGATSYTLEFEEGSIQTVEGTITFTGQTDAYLFLRSSVEDSPWNIVNNGNTESVSYVNVKDSNNTGQTITATTSSNFGNNVGWDFGAPGSYIWTGASDSEWFDAGNWDVGNIPGVNDDVTVVGVTNDPVLSGNAWVAGFTMTSGILDNNGNILYITDNATFTAGEINNGDVEATGSTTIFSGTTFGANVSVVSTAISVNNTTFEGTAVLEQSVGNGAWQNGGNTFEGDVTLTQEGTGHWYFGYTNPDVFNGNLTIQRNNTGRIYMAHNSTGNEFNGNIILKSTGTDANYIYFGAGSGTSTLAADKTITAAEGSFTRGGVSISNITQSGSTGAITHTLHLGEGSLGIGDSTLDGDIDFTAQAIVVKNNEFGGDAVMEQTVGNNDVVWRSGGNTFSGDVTLTQEGTGHWYFGYTNPDVFQGDLTIERNNTGRIYLANDSAGNEFNGNIVLESTGTDANYIYFGANGGTSTLAADKTITAAETTFTRGGISISNLTQSGSTGAITHTLHLGEGSLGVGDSTLDGDIDFKAQAIAVKNNEFGGDAVMEQTVGNVDVAWRSGGNTFNGNVTLTQEGTGHWYFGYTSPDVFEETLTLVRNDYGRIYMATDSAGNEFNGNIILESSGTDTNYIYFGVSGGTSTLAADKTITAAEGSFTRGGVSLSNITQSGSTGPLTHTLYLGGGSLGMGSCSLDGDANLTAQVISVKNNLFRGDVSMEQTTGINDPAWYSYGNTFEGETTITQSGTNSWVFGYNSPDVFKDDLTLKKTGTGGIYMARSSDGNEFHGDITIESSAGGSGMNIGYLADSTITLAADKKISVGAGGHNGSGFGIYKLVQSGSTGTPQHTLDIQGGGVIVYECALDGDVDIKGTIINAYNNTFRGDTTLEQTVGYNGTSYSGGNTFQGETTIINSGIYFLMFGYNDPDVFQDDVTFRTTGGGGVYMARLSDGNEFNGNILLESSGSGGAIALGYQNDSTLTLAGDKTIGIGAGGHSTSSGVSIFKLAQTGSTGTPSHTMDIASGALYLYGTELEGTVDFTAYSLTATNNTFKGAATLAQTNGINGGTLSGGNTFQETAAIINSGIYPMLFGYDYPDIFQGDLTLKKNGGGGIYMSRSSDGNEFNGNIIFESTSTGGALNIGYNTDSTSTLAADKAMSVGAGGFALGNLGINQLTQSGSTGVVTHTLDIETGRIGFYRCDLDSDVDFTGAILGINENTFRGDVVLEQTAGENAASYNEGNTFEGNTTVTQSAPGYYLAIGRDDHCVFLGDALFQKVGGGSFHIGYSAGNTTFAGDVTFVNTVGTIATGGNGGVMVFNGTGAVQTFDTDGSNIPRMRVASGVNAKPLNSDLNITIGLAID
ncbi:DUF2341 domain-containing protein, partial [Candidatus Omnitrophota bacterium]